MTARVPTDLADAIARNGSISFAAFADIALYGADGGFFTTGGGAGRDRGDFITSPEVGPLFGAVVANFLDRRWRELGRPDPFVVVEAGAGRGALALAVRAAEAECAPALRYVLVERSPAWRARQGEHLALVHPFEVLGPDGDPDQDRPAAVAGTGPVFCSLEDLPAQQVDGVVIANELLDNLAVRLLQRTGSGWNELHVTTGPPDVDPDAVGDANGDVGAGAGVDGRPGAGTSGVPDATLRWIAVPAARGDAERAEDLAPDAGVGAVIPLQEAASAWVDRALATLRRGSVVVVDYAADTASLARRPVAEWLRTYRGHERGTDPLSDVGGQDITCEVAPDQLPAGWIASSQAEWLVTHGIEALVEDGRRRWTERAGIGDLDAMRARSRIVEADALVDPGGLGGFTVLEWRR